MARITHGLRFILSHRVIYSEFQALMGAHKLRLKLVENYVKPFPGMKILDVGCGQGHILDYLPHVECWGYDISEAYIAQAKTRFCNGGEFNCKQLNVEDIVALPKFDVALALGLLHHLNDAGAEGC